MQFNYDETGRVSAVHQIGDEAFPKGMTAENCFDFVLKKGKLVYEPLQETHPETPEKTVAGLKAQIQALTETNTMYEEILVEMAEIVYA